jgi:hypothetical protein
MTSTRKITSNLIHLAGRAGKVMTAFVPRLSPLRGDKEVIPSPFNDIGRHVGSAIVRFETNAIARATRDVLGGIVVGGRGL